MRARRYLTKALQGPVREDGGIPVRVQPPKGRTSVIKVIFSFTYHSAAERTAPDWPDWQSAQSARSPVSTGLLSDWHQRTKRLSPLTPATAPTALKSDR